jgi:hypothetical protein
VVVKHFFRDMHVRLEQPHGMLLQLLLLASSSSWWCWLLRCHDHHSWIVMTVPNTTPNMARRLCHIMTKIHVATIHAPATKWPKKNRMLSESWILPIMGMISKVGDRIK